MITLDEYKEKVKPIVEIEDPEEQSRKAEELYKELTAGMTVGIIEHDWKDYKEHWREVCRQIKELDTTDFWHFDSFHDFPNGSLDAIITVISKEEITEEFAEALADLVVNLGAEGS